MVVEDGLVLSKWLMVDPVFVVLILVVVEDGLVRTRRILPFLQTCLNPCCDGRWSRTWNGVPPNCGNKGVLILVVMEDGLVHVDPEFDPSDSTQS